MMVPCSVTTGPTALEFVGVVAGTSLVALVAFAVVLLTLSSAPTLVDRREAAGRMVISAIAWLAPTVVCAWFLSSLIVY